MITMDDKQIRRFERELGTFKESALPYASRHTVNSAAFSAQREYRSNAREDMITRNKFTEQSIRVQQTRTLDVKRQVAVVGSTAPYMEDQEFGATISKRGKVGVAIPTTVASGEGEGVQPRRRLVPRARRLGSIALQRNGVKAKSRKQTNYLKIRMAAQTGRKFIFLDLQRHPGIYRVTGGKRNPQIRLIHDLSRRSVTIRKRPMLRPAVQTVAQKIPSIYLDALAFQIKRHGLFK